MSYVGYSSVQIPKHNSNAFDLSHDVKTSFNQGELVPVCCLECLPGDRFNMACTSVVRFAPLISPVMHRLDSTVHYFYVPNRILWSGWKDFMVNKEGHAAFPFITINVNSPSNHTRLADYMGIPPPTTAGNDVPLDINALPFAAYQAIWNEYYRDENLQTEISFELANGDNTAAWATKWGLLRKRAWQHDRFTSALPFAQKGDPISIPVGGFDDVLVKRDTGGAGSTVLTGTPDSVTLDYGTATPNIDVADLPMYAETSSLEAQAVTINDFRLALTMQKWLELNARAGTRYFESLWARWGVKSPDMSLQRPVYVTGSKAPVVISEVLNHTGTDDLPQANMAGHGLSVNLGKYGGFKCPEHGFIIGIMNVQPVTAYCQGVPKWALKINDIFDYADPMFAHLGEEAIFNDEIYAFTSHGKETFGYTSRFSDYKDQHSMVSGDFRTTLNYWHCARLFNALSVTPPPLQESFIVADPTERIFASNDPAAQKMYAHIGHHITKYSKLPIFGTPYL